MTEFTFQQFVHLFVGNGFKESADVGFDKSAVFISVPDYGADDVPSSGNFTSWSENLSGKISHGGDGYPVTDSWDPQFPRSLAWSFVDQNEFEPGKAVGVVFYLAADNLQVFFKITLKCRRSDEIKTDGFLEQSCF